MRKQMLHHYYLKLDRKRVELRLVQNIVVAQIDPSQFSEEMASMQQQWLKHS